ncbi:MAG: shikimate kinase [Chitinophagaceae bacterium]|nr:shikimate kinase [Chitinophagaceae bacterium]
MLLNNQTLKRVFLIGFMGSGKTHWGKLLAGNMDTPFFDLDEVIVKAEGKSIADIFASEGEEYFRYKERDLLEELVENNKRCVVSCGGGTPCFFNNIDFMKKEGEVIWLNTHIDVLVRRLLRQKSARPIIRLVPDDELKSFILKKMQDRRLYYEQADLVIKEENLTLQHLTELLTN